MINSPGEDDDDAAPAANGNLQRALAKIDGDGDGLMVADRRRRTATAFEWPRAYLNVHRSRAHVCVFSLGARDWEYPVSRSFIYAVSVSFFYYRPAPPPLYFKY
jgi:hypothetical protein